MRSDTVFDTHEIARSLTAADLTDAQADAITAAVRRAVEHDAAAAVDVDALATKADVAALEERMAHFATKEDLRAELAGLEERMAHFEERMTHFATKEDVAALEERMGIKTTAELAGLEARLAWRLVGAGVAIAGIQAAALFALLRMVGTGG